MSKSSLKKPVDPEVVEFESALMRSLQQAKSRNYAKVHTPQMIAATKGRPLGTMKENAKKAVTVRYAPEVIDAFRATGPGWQARMNEILVEAVRSGRLR